jgi:hypothetical protein
MCDVQLKLNALPCHEKKVGARRAEKRNAGSAPAL